MLPVARAASRGSPAAAGPRSRARSRRRGGRRRSSVHSGASLVCSGFSPRYISAVRLADHLDVAERVVDVRGREVEVVEPERLLEHRRVGLLATAPAPPGCCGTCSCARPGPSRWPGRRGCASFADASSSLALLAAPQATTTMSAVNVSRAPSRSTTTPRDRRAARRRSPAAAPRRRSPASRWRARAPGGRRAPRRRTSRARGTGSRRSRAAHAARCTACRARRAGRRRARGTGAGRPPRGRRRAAGCAARG